MEIIRTENLAKRFGSMVALDDVSLRIREGEIYGFLGLNGAGKTTLIRILLGLMKPTAGHVSLLGRSLTRDFPAWNDVGYLVETPHAYPNLTVRENLRVYALLRKLHPPSRIDEIMEQLKLVAYRDTPAGVLSLGNQQRLGLAKALLHKPRLLVLDEPINGLDPEGIVEVRNMLKALAQAGTTIFLSSHLLSEIARTAQRIGILHMGKLITELSVDELHGRLIRKLIVKTTDNPAALRHLSGAGFAALAADEATIEVTGSNALDEPEKITALLAAHKLPPRQVYTFTEDLEAFFLRTIGHPTA